jgi:thiol-disulfide isomerase/thioredoxin
MHIPLSVALLAVCLPSTLRAQAKQDPVFKEQLDLGQSALMGGKYKDAIEAFKKANKLRNNSCGECLLMLAVAYYRSGELKKCEESCDRALASAGDDKVRAPAHNLKGNVAFAGAGPDNQQMSAAEREFRSAVQLDPTAAIFHFSLATALLRESKDDEAKQELQACLALNPDEKIANDARRMMADPRRGRENFAPEFEIDTLQGQKVSLKELSGRVIVMDFWATWCPPCRASVPELKDLTKRYPLEKLVLISVSADKDEGAWREFVAKKKMDWAQYRDVDDKVLKSFGIHSFPTYLVIDGDGIIRQRLTGLNPQETVVHRLKDTLAQMPQLEGEVRK